MRYMGSKARHAKEILSIVLRDRLPDQWYVEPFVGGFNMMDKVDGPRLANDLHFYLIELFREVQNGWIPPAIDKETYNDVQHNRDFWPSYFVGFVGFGCSFGGKWFGGFARGGKTAAGHSRDHSLESSRALTKQASRLKNVRITNYSYDSLPIPSKSVIYCDPPYRKTTLYANRFDNDLFWSWCRNMSQHHTLFVSEYEAPEDFECVWSKKIQMNSVQRKTGEKQATENLWRYTG